MAFTQEAMAGAAQLAPPFITTIEAAAKQPTVSALWRLATALELSPWDFVRRVDQRHASCLVKSGK